MYLSIFLENDFNKFVQKISNQELALCAIDAQKAPKVGRWGIFDKDAHGKYTNELLFMDKYVDSCRMVHSISTHPSLTKYMNKDDARQSHHIIRGISKLYGMLKADHHLQKLRHRHIVLFQNRKIGIKEKSKFLLSEDLPQCLSCTTTINYSTICHRSANKSY